MSEHDLMKKQLQFVTNEIAQLEKTIAKLKHTKEQLTEELQATCAHVWNPPIKGYEHEGQTCAVCNVNDIFAPVIKARFAARK